MRQRRRQKTIFFNHYQIDKKKQVDFFYNSISVFKTKSYDISHKFISTYDEILIESCWQKKSIIQILEMKTFLQHSSSASLKDFVTQEKANKIW